MRAFVLIFILISALVFSQYSGKVIAIKDGDTVVALFEDNTQKTLRMAEVDCPESGQPFGKNAKDFTSREIFGKQVKYWTTDTDRYGRTIAKIFYDEGKYISEELLVFI